MKRVTMLFVALHILLSSCQKAKIERKIKNAGALSIDLDSAYIRVPNIFTPNNDNVNDNLVVFKFNISWFSLDITDDNNNRVYLYSEYSNSSPQATVWDGMQKIAPDHIRYEDGIYTCHLLGETEKGERFDKTFSISCISNPKRFCFEKDDDTFFGTQFDIVINNFNKSINSQEPNNCW